MVSPSAQPILRLSLALMLARSHRT